jgi:hypothetical protein
MSEPEERSGDTGKAEKAVELVSRLTQRITNLQTVAQTVGREAVLVEQDIRFLLLEITNHLKSLETLFQELQKILTRYNDRDAKKKKAPQEKKGGKAARRTRAKKAG